MTSWSQAGSIVEGVGTPYNDHPPPAADEARTVTGTSGPATALRFKTSHSRLKDAAFPLCMLIISAKTCLTVLH